MWSFRQILRFVETLAVPILLGLVSRYFWGGEKKEETPKSLYLPLLTDIGFVPRAFPSSYRSDVPELADYQRVSIFDNATDPEKPEVTAVLMNWSRFPNVMLITSLLCAPWLDNTIAEILIWNNHPVQLKYEDMKNTGCPRSKLRIHNSQSNMLFQARYLACSDVNTPYCFVQDDDYLVHSEIIQSLYARINSPGASRAIHLLPPHEHLSTTLREIHVPAPDKNHISDIHTSFAWLGHGTMMHRSEASNFMSLLRYLRATSAEKKMADNFFSILGNRVPEVWFDQGFGLGGGQAFTDGDEGDERNRNFTLKATEYLRSLAQCGRASCDSGAKSSLRKLPYVTLEEAYNPDRWMRTACRGTACVLETNIRALPAEISHTATNVADILSLEVQNSEILGETGKANYLENPLSHAVDAKTSSVFRSLEHAAGGDILMMDVLVDISEDREWTTIELVWLVDSPTSAILASCAFDWSSDKVTWNPVSYHPICYDTDKEAKVEGEQVPLRECSVQMVLGSSALHLRATGRYFRVQLQEDRSERWVISEVWLRGF